jgi:hypothetical protein
MQNKRWMKNFGVAILTAGWLLSGNLHAASTNNDGYSLEDFTLSNANDLVDVCTVDKGHGDYEVAAAFCYGFLEGATHYDDAIAGSQWYGDIVCDPPEITRSQALEVFVQFMKAHPQYGSEKPVDAIFRALVDKWPCAE